MVRLLTNDITVRQKVALQVLHKFDELSWKNESNDSASPLTSRETEILNYVAQGWLNKQIATELGISEQTIKNHVTSILRKLNAGARTEAVVVAIKQGLDYSQLASESTDSFTSRICFPFMSGIWFSMLSDIKKLVVSKAAPTV